MVIADKSDFGRDFLLDAESDNRFHFSIGTGRKVASTTVIQIGRWYHVALTGEATDAKKWRVRLFLDGKQVEVHNANKSSNSSVMKM